MGPRSGIFHAQPDLGRVDDSHRAACGIFRSLVRVRAAPSFDRCQVTTDSQQPSFLCGLQCGDHVHGGGVGCPVGPNAAPDHRRSSRAAEPYRTVLPPNSVANARASPPFAKSSWTTMTSYASL